LLVFFVGRVLDIAEPDLVEGLGILALPVEQPGVRPGQCEIAAVVLCGEILVIG